MSIEYFVVSPSFVSIITSILPTCILAGGECPLTILWSVLVLCLSLPPFYPHASYRVSMSIEYFVVCSSFVYIITSILSTCILAGGVCPLTILWSVLVLCISLPPFYPQAS